MRGWFFRKTYGDDEWRGLYSSETTARPMIARQLKHELRKRDDLPIYALRGPFIWPICSHQDALARLNLSAMLTQNYNLLRGAGMHAKRYWAAAVVICLLTSTVAWSAKAETADCPATMSYIRAALGIAPEGSYAALTGGDPSTYIWAAWMYGCQFPIEVKADLVGKGYRFDDFDQILLGNTPATARPSGQTPSPKISFKRAYDTCVKRKLHQWAFQWSALNDAAKNQLASDCRAFARNPNAKLYNDWRNENARIDAEIYRATHPQAQRRNQPQSSQCQQVLNTLQYGIQPGYGAPERAQQLANWYNAHCLGH